LLDFAKVQPDGSEFKLELAVPLDAIKERLAFCRDERKAGEEAKGAEVRP
jgi:predicted transport protein